MRLPALARPVLPASRAFLQLSSVLFSSGLFGRFDFCYAADLTHAFKQWPMTTCHIVCCCWWFISGSAIKAAVLHRTTEKIVEETLPTLRHEGNSVPQRI